MLAQRVYGSLILLRVECASRQISLFFLPLTFYVFPHSPPKRISELVPLEQTKQPAIKIMSRSAQDRIRAQSQSRTGSVNGEDAESSDIEPSETGSVGGRSSAPIRLKKGLTLEEREAAYNEARSRIFFDFEKKKENDMSASSSTFSLVSGSASTSGGGSSSAGDIDDSISTVPTESEFSGPIARDNKNERRNGSGTNSASSSRSMLSHKHPSSTRGSRAPSPSSFTFASIYEPVPNTVPYDISQAPPMQPPYPQQFMFPYPPPPPEQGPGQGFMQPLPYYQYNYPQPPPLPPPPQHHTSGSDLTGSTGDPQTSGLFAPPPQPSQQMMYMTSYPWAPNLTPAGPSAPLSSGPSIQHPHPAQYSFPPASAPQYVGYNVPAYFPPMGPMHTPAQGQQPIPQPAHPIGMSPLPQGNDLGIRVMPPTTMMNNDHVDSRGRKRGNSRNGGGSLSHGPMFQYSFGISGGTGASSPIEGNASPVGPRLNNTMRRTSGTSNGSRTPGDEASSVTVSSIYPPLHH
jgi:hypothetical protein